MKLDSFDRKILLILAGLVLAIGVIVAWGDRAGIGIGIISVGPPEGSQPSAIADIYIEFAQLMNMSSVTARLSIEPSITGELFWNANKIVLRPLRPLASRQTYVVTLAPGAETADGQRATRPLRWSFKPLPPAVMFLNWDVPVVRRLSRVPLAGGTPQALYAASTTILDATARPDGRQIALSVLGEGGKADIVFADAANGATLKRLGCLPSSCSNPVWSPDGKLLTLARNEPTPNQLPGQDRVWLYEPATGRMQPAFQDNQILGTRPVWSANGKRLAFFDENRRGVHVLDLTSQATFFVSGLLGDSGSLSPDGLTLAYTSRRESDPASVVQVWLARLDTPISTQPLLEDTTMLDQSPAWSPDGQWIAFHRRSHNAGAGNHVMIFKPATRELRQITRETGYSNTDLRWDALGQYLLVQRFDHNAGNQPQLWFYDMATGQFTRLVEGLHGQWLP